MADLNQILEGFHNEDESDESGEGLLRESSDVPHEGARISGHQDDADDAGPETDP